MSKKLVTSYTFTAAAKTIVSADFTGLEKIQLITNVTRNIIIYNFASPTLGGTLSGTTLTLTYNTAAAMADADKLQIFVEDAAVSIPVSAASLPLPSGAATSAKQDTGNTSVASIDTKIPALGQALAAASVPVILPTATITTLTPPAAITGFATAAKQPALGTAGTASVDVITVQGKTAMTPLVVDPSGVTSPVSLASVPSHAVTNAGTFAVQAASAGDVAHNAVDSGNPQKMGGQARTTNPTAVADAARTNFIADKLGKQVVVGSIRDLKGRQTTTITASIAETTIVTAVASTFLDIYRLVIANTSATACQVTIKDSTAGTTADVIEVPALGTAGWSGPESAAANQTTVSNNWTATCGTSVTSIIVTAYFVKNT